MYSIRLAKAAILYPGIRDESLRCCSFFTASQESSIRLQIGKSRDDISCRLSACIQIRFGLIWLRDELAKQVMENMFSVPRPTATARHRQDALVQTGQLGLTLTPPTEAICRDPAVMFRRPKTAFKHSGSSNSKKHSEYLCDNNRLLVAHRTHGHC